MSESQYVVALQLNILRELKSLPDAGAVVLDLGCGNGEIVAEYRENSFQGFGCDFQFKEGPKVASLHESEVIRLIDGSRYRLPFDDNSFDLVVSNQVFEHVQDYPSCLSEIVRVLKPGGIGLHMFPSRYRPIEAHVYVPFASIIKQYWWLLIWAYLGIRKQAHKNLSPGESAEDNCNYLNKYTNYLNKSELKKYMNEYFSEVKFCEKEFLKHTRRGHYINKISAIFPFIPSLYSAFRSRVVFFRK